MKLSDRHRQALDLVTHLVVREFRLRYRRALLGWIWAIVPALTRLLVLSVVFTRVVPLGIEDYPLFLFTGLIGWSWFSAGIESATSSAVTRRELLFRPGLPRAAVPVVSVLADGLDYLAALPVVAAFLLANDGIPASALALPLILILQLSLALGLGLALCAANVYLRDVSLFLGVALTLGFYATPVLYPPELVPAKLRLFVTLNPMSHLLDAQRDVLLGGYLPRLTTLLLVGAVCVVSGLAGYFIYRARSPLFVDEL